MSKLLTKEDIKRILSSRFEKDRFTTLSSLPSPNMLKGISKAAKRITRAIEKKEKITIVGDYDVDGVISSYIINDFLQKIGGDVNVVIPDRFSDGYGISKEIIDEIDSTLIVTVDNGISAIEAANECKKRGIDLIITDHHSTPEILPDAYAIVNPKQKDCLFPYKEICGAQVAWYLVASIKKEIGIEFNLLEYIDLLSIAIVADMMELKEFNRVMVRRGLKELNRTKRVPILSIKEKFNKKFFVSEDISYLLAPLLNSAGRMQNAKLAFDFLNSKSINEAKIYLDRIIALNEKRKEIEKEFFEKALAQVDEKSSVIVVWGEDWHEGVIGIVAARLAKRFKKPAIVFSINGNIAKGSARSFADVDILSLITLTKSIIDGYGGHKGAAGLNLQKDRLQEFKKEIQSFAISLDKELFVPKKEILGEIEPKEIDFELLNILESFEPYGQNNPKPHFMLRNTVVKKCRILGKEQNHQKLILSSDHTILESIDFNFEKKVDIGSKINLTFSISKNNYRGYITPQLLISEIL